MLAVASLWGGTPPHTLGELQERGLSISAQKDISSEALTYTVIKCGTKVALVDTIQSKSSSATFMILLHEDTIEELIILDASKGYGDRIDNRFWLKQFKGLKIAKVQKSVDAISGATLVSDDIKAGVIAVAEDYVQQK